MTDIDYAQCVHCRQPVKPTGYNFEHFHVQPFDPDYPEECRPTYAAPNHSLPRIPLTPPQPAYRM
jgi:hypothetical protein